MSRRAILFGVGVVFLIVFGAVVLPVSEWLIPRWVPGVGRVIGVEMELGSVRIRPGEPLGLSGLRFRVRGEMSLECRVERLQVWLNPLSRWGGEDARWIREVKVDGLWLWMRIPPPPEESLSAARDGTAQTMRIPEVPIPVVPEMVQLDILRLEVEWAGGALRVGDGALRLMDKESGELSLSRVDLELGAHVEVYRNLTGRTSWRGDQVGLRGLVVGRDIVVDRFDFRWQPGLELGVRLRAFGGSIEGDAHLEIREMLPWFDATLMAGGLDVAPILSLFGEEARGSIDHLSADFSGFPDLPEFASGSMEITASGLEWRSRPIGSTSLKIALRDRRVILDTGEIVQGENNLRVAAGVHLPIDLVEPLQSTFELSLQADVARLEDVWVLFQPASDIVTGSVNARVEVRSRSGRADGEIEVSGQSIGYGGFGVDGVRLRGSLHENLLSIHEAAVMQNADSLHASGTIGLGPSLTYQGTAQLRVHDIGEYSTLPESPLPVISGSISADWSGEGGEWGNRGEANISLADLISEWTPSGLSIDTAVKYSPKELAASQTTLTTYGLTLKIDALEATENHLRAGGIEVSDSQEVIASGKLVLPIDCLALLSGTTRFLPEGPLDISVRTPRELSLKDVMRQVPTIVWPEGTMGLSLRAQGTLLSPLVDGELFVNELTMPEAGDVPALSASLTIQNSGKESIDMAGTLSAGELPQLELNVTLPLPAEVESSGEIRWLNPEHPISGLVRLPSTDLSPFRQFVPAWRRLEGVVSGLLRFRVSESGPELEGTLRLADGAVTVMDGLMPIESARGEVVFRTKGLSLRGFRALSGAAPLTLEASVDWSDPEVPAIDARLVGGQALIFRSPDARVRANVVIDARGRGGRGRVEGRIELIDSRIYRRFEITPLIAPTPAQEARPFVAPSLEGIVPPPYSDWVLDVRLGNANDFLLSGNLARGSIVPNVELLGTLGNPTLAGSIDLHDMRAFLPFSIVTVRRGAISFKRDLPFMPMLDISAESEIMDYDVNIFAYGPLSEPGIVMRSNPPLSQEEILLMLSLGQVPGSLNNDRFGEAAAGQGGLLLLRTLARQFDALGIDTENLFNRIQISTSPPRWPGGSGLLRGRVNIWKGLSFETTQDTDGFYNVGAGYRFRFR